MNPAATFFYISVGVGFWLITTVVIVVAIYAIYALKSFKRVTDDVHQSFVNLGSLKRVLTLPFITAFTKMVRHKKKGGE